MQLYDLKIDEGLYPRFSWKCRSDRRGDKQTAYQIAVTDFDNNLIWDTKKTVGENSLYIKYTGNMLAPCSQYKCTVTAWDSDNNPSQITCNFKTHKRGTDKSFWHGAEWIGAPAKTINPSGLQEYIITAEFTADKTGIAVGARNKDNYALFEIDIKNQVLSVQDISDNAWSGAYNEYTTNAPYKKETDRFDIPNSCIKNRNTIKISVSNLCASVWLNGECIIDNCEVMPKTIPNQPYREFMHSWGIYQRDGIAEFYSIKIETVTGNILKEDNFSNDNGSMSVLGTVKDGKLIVENEFNLTSAVPAVNLRKSFIVKGTVKRAVLYSAAMGFYEAYINGKRTDSDFYNPGFTDYRKRIMYQTYDITEMIKSGTNTIGAVVAKGYYSGFLGYNFYPMIYGQQNYFIAQLIIEYTDGISEVISTDDTWEFTDKSPIIDADYLQGEIYDARLKFDWNDSSDSRWQKCGVGAWNDDVQPTNGTLSGVQFELCPQNGPTAQIERIITPIAECTENPHGHFVYDFGQNMVGTVRIKLRGACGQSIKLRYGEMCYKNGEIYIENLRTAGNTDVYILCGDENGEEFVPSFTSHGFRYMEITGNGYQLEKGDIEIISVEGLVITNTLKTTGSFECSNPLINKLQSNIEWGQRGNSLLVYTDCPQRNERMGWTGDAQVFAATAAYNMDVHDFMNKWLCDVRDGQLLYNRDGAVPDTAPLGGDNRRTGGCAGWGDACVIVPWEMYRAYGDISILEDNYDMMIKWVEYQNRAERKNYGMRIVDGREMPEQSDLASIPFIQCQQSRGDHLTFDETTPFILSATAYAAYVAQLVSKIAEILGKTDDSAKYAQRFCDIKRAFNEAWVRPDGSLAYWGEMSKSNTDINGNIINQTYYSNDSENRPSQTAYALAIDFGLIDSNKFSKTAECFKQSIADRDNKLSVGFLGISHLAPALTKCGYDNIAFNLLTETGFPGWLYSVINGATTIWERWNSYVAETDTFGNVAMNSFNHYSYGAIGEWMYTRICGINPMTAGYKKILLKPTIGGGLTYAKGKYDSVHGTIASDWDISDGKLKYHCTVPVGTTAELHLPYFENLTEKNDFVGAEKIKDGVFLLVSGEYWFESEI